MLSWLSFQFHKGTIKTLLMFFLSLKISYFNSIKVRLKLVFDWTMSVLSVFQFHKGTIKTKLPFGSLLTLSNFNSIKVRLKLAPAQRNLFNQQAFQFHKGTIKTRLNAVSSNTDSLFQFHKGTIKTPSAIFKWGYFDNFNSIKVRLKQLPYVNYTSLSEISIP